VGSIEPRDRQRLAEHLAEGCLECEVALADFEQSTLLLAASAPSVRPSPGLRERVLQSVSAPQAPAAAGTAGVASAAGAPAASFSAQVAQVRRRRGRGLALPAWTALAVAGLSGMVAIFSIIIAMMAHGEAGRLHGEVTGNTQVIAALNDQLEEEKRWNAVFTSPDARTAELRPISQGDAVLHGRVVFDPHTRRAVIVFENLTPISDRSFELWAVIDRTPQSMGVIKTDERGNGVLRIEDAGDPNRLNGFQVTLEKSGGSAGAAPGSLVMSGRVSG
jgi:hypothetical protein